jgi:endonuclease/exonuclease/phosphatase family metal-dependent hydrolase
VGLTRTSADSVLFSTYNMLDLFADGSAAGREHYHLAVASARALDTDVLAVQEVRAQDHKTAQARLRQLADDVGLRCTVPASGGGAARTALAMGGHGYHVGLMWRPGIEPVPGSLRIYGAGEFWHSLSYVTLDVGGTQVRHASFHATPFLRRVRADQNERLLAALRNTAGGVPVVVGADWNTESADRVYDEASRRWRLYEPGDPYSGVSWFDELIYQCEWEYDEHGQRRHWADRRPGDVLWSGGLHDAAAVLRAPWQPTTGHHPADGYGARGIRRRIDAVRVTSQVTGALRAHHVESTDLARQASDHLPVTVEYVPAAIGRATPPGATPPGATPPGATPPGATPPGTSPAR